MSGDELEQLRAQVTALSALVERTASQNEQDQDITAAAVARLEHILVGLNSEDAAPGAVEDAEDQVPAPVAWVDYATAEEWVVLCDWVDWLGQVYDLDDDRRVRPCWPAHLGVAEELAAVWSAWLEAASRAREADGDALAFWHDRYLAPFLGRVNRVYNIRLCRDKHTTMRPAGLTNRTLIDVRSAAPIEEDNGASGGPVLEVVSP